MTLCMQARRTGESELLKMNTCIYARQSVPNVINSSISCQSLASFNARTYYSARSDVNCALASRPRPNTEMSNQHSWYSRQRLAIDSNRRDVGVTENTEFRTAWVSHIELDNKSKYRNLAAENLLSEYTSSTIG